MPSRSFEDSAGVSWDVFEVRRTLGAPRGVSVGLEQGWLTFVSAEGKRRLTPFPAGWERVPDTELARLCESARVANPARYPGDGASRAGRAPPARARAAPPHAVAPRPGGDADGEPDGINLVRDAVRAFAHDARATGLPAIEAMVRLKVLVHERFGGDDAAPAARAEAADLRRVRRWFVEAFYFERPA